jgi:hypothetical protein
VASLEVGVLMRCFRTATTVLVSPRRREQVSNTIVRWRVPNHGFGAKPMIKVFAVRATFFLPYCVGYLPDGFLSRHSPASSCLRLLPNSV